MSVPANDGESDKQVTVTRRRRNFFKFFPDPTFDLHNSTLILFLMEKEDSEDFIFGNSIFECDFFCALVHYGLVA